MSEDWAIKIEHLSKVYKIFSKPSDRVREALNPFGKRYSKDFYALNDISLTIKKGETVGIIGKNGAGKSTILKIITGVLTPSSGSVQVNGRIASLLELGAGFNPEMTGIENIYMNATIMGYTKEEMDARLQNIINFADIGDFINQPVKMYSSGMFARLAFAVNAFVEPDILIVDEALSVGDAGFQAKCITRMKEMMKSGTTILFVTHEMSTIKAFCKRCLYLERGTIRLDGMAEELADIYLREIRDEMNKHNAISEGGIQKIFKKYDKDLMKFKSDKLFPQRSGFFRQGNQAATVKAFDMFNSIGEPLTLAEFNECVKLVVYIKFHEDIRLSVGYHIRNSKNEEVMGSSFTVENNGKIIEGKKGDGIVVEFSTKLPLMEGIYNVTIVVSQPACADSAVFNDFIENAYLFEIARREKWRMWDMVYIENECRANYFQNV